MEKAMRKPNQPRPKSISELAEFWDTHDLTDFENELEEVAEPLFARRNGITVPLEKREVQAIEKLAKANGVSTGELVRAWVVQKLPRRSPARRTKRGT
jgi:CopG antitoxin of type II toxin-antitoxin system